MSSLDHNVFIKKQEIGVGFLVVLLTLHHLTSPQYNNTSITVKKSSITVIDLVYMGKGLKSW